MIHSKACRDLIASFEGCRLTAYPDPATGGEPITIGFGHTQLGLKLGTVWTQAQADEALDHDLEAFDKRVSFLTVGRQTTQSQFDAMVSFAFNVGSANLAKSTLLKKHNAGDYDGAAAEFQKWNKGNGVVMPGLVRRRNAEAQMYRGTL